MTPRSPAQDELCQRLRDYLAAYETREVAMFRGVTFMVNEKMVASVRKDGGLLLRVDPRQHDDMLTRPGAVQAMMGSSRALGAGWLEVQPDVLDDDQTLADWLDVALAFNATLTGRDA